MSSVGIGGNPTGFVEDEEWEEILRQHGVKPSGSAYSAASSLKSHKKGAKRASSAKGGARTGILTEQDTNRKFAPGPKGKKNAPGGSRAAGVYMNSGDQYRFADATYKLASSNNKGRSTSMGRVSRQSSVSSRASSSKNSIVTPYGTVTPQPPAPRRSSKSVAAFKSMINSGSPYPVGFLSPEQELSETSPNAPTASRPNSATSTASSAITRTTRAKKKPPGPERLEIVYAWGTSKNGELGLGAENVAVCPTSISSFAGMPITQVACGQSHNLAMTVDGRVYSWGGNEDGQLGLNNTDARHSPALIKALRGVHVVQVACGNSHSMVLSKSGDVFSWGSGQCGQLGHGNTNTEVSPKRIGALEGAGVRKIACGISHSCCIDEGGRVRTWGKGWYGQLGHGVSEDEFVPRVVASMHDVFVSEISCGGGHTVAIDEHSDVYVWGWNKDGQLGLGDVTNVRVPKKLAFLEGMPVQSIMCGEDFSVAIMEDGELFSWGMGVLGQLGHGENRVQMTPKHIKGLEGKRVVSVACGVGFTMAVSEKGDVYTWGWGNRSQYENGGNVVDLLRPCLVEHLSGKRIATIACGRMHTLAVVDWEAHQAELQRIAEIERLKEAERQRLVNHMKAGCAILIQYAWRRYMRRREAHLREMERIMAEAERAYSTQLALKTREAELWSVRAAKFRCFRRWIDTMDSAKRCDHAAFVLTRAMRCHMWRIKRAREVSRRKRLEEKRKLEARRLVAAKDVQRVFRGHRARLAFKAALLFAQKAEMAEQHFDKALVVKVFDAWSKYLVDLLEWRKMNEIAQRHYNEKSVQNGYGAWLQYLGRAQYEEGIAFAGRRVARNRHRRMLRQGFKSFTCKLDIRRQAASATFKFKDWGTYRGWRAWLFHHVETRASIKIQSAFRQKIAKKYCYSLRRADLLFLQLAAQRTLGRWKSFMKYAKATRKSERSILHRGLSSFLHLHREWQSAACTIQEAYRSFMKRNEDAAANLRQRKACRDLSAASVRRSRMVSDPNMKRVGGGFIEKRPSTREKKKASEPFELEHVVIEDTTQNMFKSSNPRIATSGLTPGLPSDNSAGTIRVGYDSIPGAPKDTMKASLLPPMTRTNSSLRKAPPPPPSRRKSIPRPPSEYNKTSQASQRNRIDP